MVEDFGVGEERSEIYIQVASKDVHEGYIPFKPVTWYSVHRSERYVVCKYK